jgi:glycosyltransferase involved in cell wall biosynthesis
MQNRIGHIDVVVPVYAPEEGWVTRIDQDWSHIDQKVDQEDVYHLIVVNDGRYAFSNEDITALKQLKKIKIIREVTLVEYEGNHGKGYAIRAGLEVCKSNFIVYTDNDFPYGLEVIHQFAEKLNLGSDVVIATRNQDYFDQLTRARRMISKGLITFNRRILGLQHPDTQAGLKAVNRRGREIILGGREKGFLFEVEWIRKAENEKLKISTLEVQLKEGVSFSGIISLRPLQLMLSYLRLIFKT